MAHTQFAQRSSFFVFFPHWFKSAAAIHLYASARECTLDVGGLSYPGKDTGGSRPGQTRNQGDWLWPVSHCQGSHLDERTHKENPIVCRSVYILKCVYIDWCCLDAL